MTSCSLLVGLWIPPTPFKKEGLMTGCGLLVGWIPPTHLKKGGLMIGYGLLVSFCFFLTLSVFGLVNFSLFRSILLQ